MEKSTRTMDFIFDFGSPNAYLVHRVLPAFSARTGITVNYIPCLLGGIFKGSGNQAPMVSYSTIPSKMQYEMLELRRFVKRHQIPLVMNPHFPVNTLAPMRGAVVAQQEGFLADYVEGLMHYMWEEPRKLDDPQVFAETLETLGFDAAHLLQRIGDNDIKQALVANTEDAVRRGVFGIPTFFVGDAMWFGKERLRDIEEYVNEG